jgi:YidC/Oxa1 family membrane protein insertase
MEKRIPLALLLSMVVLFGWSYLYRKELPPPASTTPPALASQAQEPPAQEAAQSSAEGAALTPALPQATLADESVRELEFDVGGDEPGAPGRYHVKVTNRGGALVELRFRDYVTRVGLTDLERAEPANWLPLLEPLAAQGLDGRPLPTGSLLLETQPSSEALAPHGLAEVLWQMREVRDPDTGSLCGVVFRYGPGTGLVFEKRLTFEPGTWRVRLVLTIENEGAIAAGPREFRLIPAGWVPPELNDSFYPEPRAVAIGHDASDDVDEIDEQSAPHAREDKQFKVPTPVLVTGVFNKYFAFLLREEAGTGAGTMLLPSYVYAQEASAAAAGAPPPRKLIQAQVPVALRIPEPGQSASYAYTVYAGPKRPDAMVADFEPHELVLDRDLGTWSVVVLLGHGMLAVLRLFHGLCGNWGVAIILLTLLVRLVLFPINRRSQTAMARYQSKMKRVQPKLEEVKKRFASDPKKLREAQARIMQEEGAFPPLGGCLPMFLQLPVFFGLFSALRTSFDLRQAPFGLWIQDLSRPDQLLRLDLRLPLLPDIEHLNVLPILMVVLWVLQQLGMPKPADEQAARMQKMMMFMPVIFGVFLYNYAAGLSLYMMTTSGLSIVEQKVIKKFWPIDDTEVVKKKSGCGPFSGTLEHLAQKSRAHLEKSQAMQAELRRQGGKRKRKR